MCFFQTNKQTNKQTIAEEGGGENEEGEECLNIRNFPVNK